MIHYAVVVIVSHRVLYVGTRISTAARWLEPGTCWGKGMTEQRAVREALDWAAVFKKERAA